MTIQYQLTFDDYREARGAADRMKGISRTRISRTTAAYYLGALMMFLLLFAVKLLGSADVRIVADDSMCMVAGAVLVAGSFVLAGMLVATAGDAPDMKEILLPQIPWYILLTLHVAMVARGQSRAMRRGWEASGWVRAAKVVDISADEIAVRDDLIDCRWKWPNFIRARETSNLFVLLMASSSYLIIPKRAFGSEEELNAMRAMMGHLLQINRSVGFPVVLGKSPDAAAGRDGGKFLVQMMTINVADGAMWVFQWMGTGMLIQFQYTFEDFREAKGGVAELKAARKKKTRSSTKFVVIIVVAYLVLKTFGFLDNNVLMENTVFMLVGLSLAGMGIVMFKLIRGRTRWKQAWKTIALTLSALMSLLLWGWLEIRLQGAGELEVILLSQAPWYALLVIFVVNGVRVQGTTLRQLWDESPATHLPKTAEITVDGIMMRDELTEHHWKWAVFMAAKETSNVFVLMMSPSASLMFPKRAFESEEQLNAMRAMMGNLLEVNRTVGFPVVVGNSRDVAGPT